jgi:hypothetical protein
LFAVNISWFVKTFKVPLFVMEMLCFPLDGQTVPKEEIYRAAQHSLDIQRNM